MVTTLHSALVWSSLRVNMLTNVSAANDMRQRCTLSCVITRYFVSAHMSKHVVYTRLYIAHQDNGPEESPWIEGRKWDIN